MPEQKEKIEIDIKKGEPPISPPKKPSEVEIKVKEAGSTPIPLPKELPK